jgi:hypothetical protein
MHVVDAVSSRDHVERWLRSRAAAHSHPDHGQLRERDVARIAARWPIPERSGRVRWSVPRTLRSLPRLHGA